MSSSSLISRNNLFQIQRYIPRSWKKSLPLPRHNPATTTPPTWVKEREEESPIDSPNHPLDSLIDSIKTLTSEGHLSKAFMAYSVLRLYAPSSLLILKPISSLLLCSTTLKTLPQGKQLHAHIISLGFLENSFLVSRLTSFYVTFGLLCDACVIAQGSSTSHVLPWNLLISAYVRNGFFGDALLAYKQMVERGVMVDKFTYPSVLSACGEMLELGLGRKIHERIDTSGMEWNLFVQNALVAMYAKCGALDIARNLFEGMPERDVISWNSIISGYASKGMWEAAFELFERMRMEGSEVNIVTWNTIINGNMQMGNHMEALRLISQMGIGSSGIDPVTLVIGLNTCSRIGSMKLGKQIHGLTVRVHLDRLECVRNALITMYSRCRNTGVAYILFRMAGIQSLVTWNAMIAGFALSDQAEEASSIFREMVWSGLQPNYVTVVTILSLCARVANLQHGRELHCFITKHGFKGYRLLWNSLVDMYSKSGRISVAQRVFKLMNDRDEVSYTSLIAGYGMQGEGITALKLFDEMIEHGIKPDHITMVAVLSACSHSGLVTQGQMLFDKMVCLYGVVPRLEHFSCMVDLFGRAGLLRKAEEILNKMPVRPSAAMWAALVGACRIYGNTEIGERAARRLLEVGSGNPGHYTLIANMYASAGCWEELAKVRILMRDMGLRKAPGCAWVDLGNGFYPFLVGDRSNPYTDQIYVLLGELSGHMRDAGYVGNKDFGFDEEVEL